MIRLFPSSPLYAEIDHINRALCALRNAASLPEWDQRELPPELERRTIEQQLVERWHEASKFVGVG